MRRVARPPGGGRWPITVIWPVIEREAAEAGLAPGLLYRSAMTPQELRNRIDRFGDDVITFCRKTSSDPLSLRLLIQLQDAATSTASNYRAACRAQSKAVFVAKLSIALEEADESVGWLQHLSHQGIGHADTVERLLGEAGEISAILNASRETAQGRRRRPGR